MQPRKKQQKPVLVENTEFKKYFKTNINVWHNTINRKINKDEEKNDFWELLTEHVPNTLVYEPSEGDHYTRYSNVRYKHPLVEKREAYWIDDNTLLKGYVLKNTSVFRPIFSLSRERKLNRMRNDIVKYSKIFSAKARSHLYKCVLMETTKLPEVIIDEIVLLTWDILLLL